MAIFVPRFVRQLRDVLLTAPADGEVLTYDSADEKWKNEAGGGGGGDLTDAVILAPASSARNVIQPTAGDVIAAIVKAHAAQSASLMEWQDSTGGVRMSVSPTGTVLIEPNAVFQTALILKSFDPASAQQETFQIKDSGGNTAFEVQNCGETIWRFLEPTQSSGLSVVDQVGIAGPLLNIFAVSSDGIEVRNDGSLIIVNTTGSALLASGTFMPWLDPTNGAAKFMVKGATLDGTVVTWEFEDGVYTPGGGGAPTTATYITQTPDAGLSAEQALSALATGLVKNTTGTGVLSIAVPGTDYPSQAAFDDHSARHENGGADEISIAGLDGTPVELTNHLSDATDAHDASAVSVADVAGDYTATDVEGVLAEIAPQLGGGGGSSRYTAADVVSAVDVVSTTTETNLLSFTVGANDLGASGVMRITLLGDYLYNNVVTETLRMRVKFGGTTVIDLGPTVPGTVLNAARRAWRLVLELSALGATNSQLVTGFWSIEDVSAAQNIGRGAIFAEGGSRRNHQVWSAITASAIDTTSAQTFAMTAQWSVAHANNSWRLQRAFAELLA